MNVLLFVTTLIMVLSLMTYSKIESYSRFAAMESQFIDYMESTERSPVNNAAEKWYNAVKGSKGNPATRSVVNASSRLSFSVFIDMSQQAKFKAEYPQLRQLAKKLIHVLYSQAPFYQALMQKRPDFADALLNGLALADQLPKDQKLKNARDLNTLRLPDEQLDDALYKMLKGTATPEELERRERTLPPLSAIELEFKSAQEACEPDDEDGDAGNLEEFRSPVGYYSLLDYITLQPKPKIRVYLASKPLLLAIFDNPATVEEIITTRQRLYSEIMSSRNAPNKDFVKEASLQFESQFLPRADSQFTKTILDFTLSKTNPKHYE